VLSHTVSGHSTTSPFAPESLERYQPILVATRATHIRLILVQVCPLFLEADSSTLQSPEEFRERPQSPPFVQAASFPIPFALRQKASYRDQRVCVPQLLLGIHIHGS
jgi:hypothetical protein